MSLLIIVDLLEFLFAVIYKECNSEHRIGQENDQLFSMTK